MTFKMILALVIRLVCYLLVHLKYQHGGKDSYFESSEGSACFRKTLVE